MDIVSEQTLIIDLPAINKRQTVEVRKKVHRDSGTPVTFNLNFIDAEQPLITPARTAARIGVADFTDASNPTGFSVYLFDTSGNRVSGVFGWQTSGYIINTP